jgi:MFS family permease
MRRVPPVTWTLLGAGAMTTLGTLPVFLLSSQSVFVRRELGLDDGQFGVAVSVFFAAAASFALLGGGLVDRLGRRRGTVVAGLVSAAGCAAVGLGVSGYASLVPAMVVLGVGNAACQVTSNLTVARAVPPHRRGLGFGVKQSAIPLSIVIAGLAVPTVGAWVGWRGTFLLTGAAALAVVVRGLMLPAAVASGAAASRPADRPPLRALVTVMLGIALASAAANSLGSFTAAWGFEVGLSPGQAGLLMAVGSALNIAVRVLAGHRADLRFGRNLPVVAAQMVVGAVALAVLSVPSPVTVVAAGLVAFAIGWSWPGLLLYAVVRVGRDAPAAATGVVQAGAFAGGAAGPALFGLVVVASSYEVAWRAAAVLFLLAAGLVTLARRMFIADLVARPPAQSFGYGGGRSAPLRTTEVRPEQEDQ